MCLLQSLSQEVAQYLGLELGGVKIKRFADGEIYVQIQVLNWSILLHYAETASMPMVVVLPCMVSLGVFSLDVFDM